MALWLGMMAPALACQSQATGAGAASEHSEPIESTAITTATTAPSAGEPSARSDEPLVEAVGDHRYAVSYRDAGGAPRTVLLEVFLPRSGGSEPVATVVWSHGGSSGKTSTTRAAGDWAPALTAKGFAVVAIAHSGRSMESREQLCAAIAVGDCSMFMYLDWDRPADVDAVLDWMLGGDTGYPFDPQRLVYGGHSAGARSVMRLAGVSMPIDAGQQPGADDRFAAFVVASPPGATEVGLAPESFDALERPMILLSGAGDTTNGNEATDRRATMDMVPSGPFVTVWVADEHTRHTTFDLDTSSCQRAGGSRQRCSEIVKGLGTMTAAFLEQSLAGRSAADIVARSAGRLPAGFEVATTE
ncbi:MAG TPA: hypothetical protein DCR14_06205 [Acidimicrobiaceae bacterium]|nr:hypothetical protein [Acidimicrobiaceae bacterium]